MKANIDSLPGGEQWRADFIPAKKPWYVYCPECQNTYQWKLGSKLFPEAVDNEHLLSQEEAVAIHLSGDYSTRKCGRCLKKAVMHRYLLQK
jgi:hypothetical protein